MPVQGLHHDFVCCVDCGDWRPTLVASLCVLGERWWLRRWGDGFYVRRTLTRWVSAGAFCLALWSHAKVRLPKPSEWSLWNRRLSGAESVGAVYYFAGMFAILVTETKQFCTSFSHTSGVGTESVALHFLRVIQDSGSQSVFFLFVKLIKTTTRPYQQDIVGLQVRLEIISTWSGSVDGTFRNEALLNRTTGF